MDVGKKVDRLVGFGLNGKTEEQKQSRKSLEEVSAHLLDLENRMQIYRVFWNNPDFGMFFCDLFAFLSIILCTFVPNLCQPHPFGWSFLVGTVL